MLKTRLDTDRLTENMIAWAKNELGNPRYAGWVPVERVLQQKPQKEITKGERHDRIECDLQMQTRHAGGVS